MSIDWDAFQLGLYIVILSFAVGVGLGWIAKILNRS